MAKKNRSTLKGYFETGGVPSQDQYADFIDSKVNLAETTSQTLAGPLSASYLHSLNSITAVGDISSATGTFGTVDTGQGANELFSMNQDVKTDSTVTFNEITSSNNVLIEGDLTVLGTTDFTNQTTTNLSLSGHLTASGNISASGYIIAQHLTASGNISASGTIHANKIIVDYASGIYGQDLNGNTSDLIIGNYNDSSLIIGNNTTPNVLMNDTIIIGNLTASGNISSSGAGDNYFGGKINLLSATAADQKITFGDGTQNIQGSTDYLIINGDNSIHLRADTKIHMSSSKVGIGHAFHDSGNSPSANFHISGSGASEETLIVEGSDGTDYLTVGLGGHITASGNIKAIGAIISNTLKVDGSQVDFTGLPTSDPGIVGRLYRTGADIKISI
tara:strand:- start:97 stop:1266 length:1170 start_codon:yes stop_codon:yes gene_type:complete